MEPQNEILEKFKILFKFPTYREISKATGIQSTRLFRIFNGYEMKLSEYIIIEKIINNKKNICSLIRTIEECSKELEIEALKEIESYSLRRLQIKRLNKI